MPAPAITTARSAPSRTRRRLCATLRIEVSEEGGELGGVALSKLSGLVLDRHVRGSVLSEDRESHTLVEIETVWATDELEALARAVEAEKALINAWVLDHGLRGTWLATHLRELQA